MMGKKITDKNCIVTNSHSYRNSKDTHIAFIASQTKRFAPAEPIYSDTWRPLNFNAKKEKRYALIICNDYTKFYKGYLISENHAIEFLNLFLTL
jgi:ornithine carbamoyltransferase